MGHNAYTLGRVRLKLRLNAVLDWRAEGNLSLFRRPLLFFFLSAPPSRILLLLLFRYLPMVVGLRLALWIRTLESAHTARLQCSLHRRGRIVSVDFSRVGNYLAIGNLDGQVTLEAWSTSSSATHIWTPASSLRKPDL